MLSGERARPLASAERLLCTGHCVKGFNVAVCLIFVTIHEIGTLSPHFTDEENRLRNIHTISTW